MKKHRWNISGINLILLALLEIDIKKVFKDPSEFWFVPQFVGEKLATRHFCNYGVMSNQFFEDLCLQKVPNLEYFRIRLKNLILRCYEFFQIA